MQNIYSTETIAAPLIAGIIDEIAERESPLFVGLDGRSGAGKSTLAAAVATFFSHRDPALDVVVIKGDDFYAGGSAATWDQRSIAQKADQVIDWRRQSEVLQQLRRQGVAEWRPFNWYAEDWDADAVPLEPTSVRTEVAPVVILEGAYSCRRELHELLDLKVLLNIGQDQRRRQLLAREGDAYRADWESRWSAAEDYYFGLVMPPPAFELVLGER